MVVIYKYNVLEGGDFQLVLPKDAKILTVQIQCGEPRIWVFGDTEEKTEVRFFKLIATGRHSEINPHTIKQYIGTFQMDEGTSVFHLFEIHE